MKTVEPTHREIMQYLGCIIIEQEKEIEQLTRERNQQAKTKEDEE